MNGPGGRVIMADDDEDARELVALRLRRAGYEVLTATRGDHALALVRTRIPDVVILDMVMPGRCGEEVMRALRADPATRAVRILALTAKVLPKDVEQILGSGADDYLAKPVEAPVLLERVAALVAVSGSRDDPPCSDERTWAGGGSPT